MESIDLIGASHLSYNTECLAEELYDVGAGGSRGKAYIDADGARAENKSEARWSESPPLVMAHTIIITRVGRGRAVNPLTK